MSKSILASSVRPVGPTSGNQGTVLFEVVVALALFVAAVVVITTALNASLNSVERLRLNVHASNLAVSVLSELELGTKTLSFEGPQPFEDPSEGWTWEAVTDPTQDETSDTSQLKKVEVVVRHTDPDLVYRLGRTIQIPAPAPLIEPEPSLAGPPF